MDLSSNVNPRARFLPSVKIKPRQKPSKNRDKDNIRLFLRPKLKISDSSCEIPELISDYYQRFRKTSQKSESISVSINFKQVSQEEFQQKAKSHKKLKTKTSTKKTRINSQSTYHPSVQQEKNESKLKIKLSPQAIFHRLKCMQLQKSKCLQNNRKRKETQKKDMKMYSHMSSQSILDETTAEECQNLKIMSISKSKNSQIKNWNKYQITTLSTLNISKKCRARFHNFDQKPEWLPQLSKRITPWKNEQQQNPQESIQILQSSIQNSQLII